MYDDWFKNVKVCFKWFPDVKADGRQCGAYHTGEVCAHINHFTANYTDDIDKRSGGCKMQWMLSVPSDAPLWMHNTRFCMTAKPETIPRRYVLGGRINQRIYMYVFWDGRKFYLTKKIIFGGTGCASDVHHGAYANKYTSAYLDDTSGHQRHCKMQWGIFYE